MAATPENIVVIMTDQQRADISAREGFDLDTTPFLDEMATGGTWFDRAYTSTPVCAPARESFLTGRFPNATGVWANQTADKARIDADLFDVMTAAGFETAMIGKSHSHLTADRVDHRSPLPQRSGHEANRTDEERAFDRWQSEELDNGPALEPTPFPIECQHAYRAISAAREWLRSLQDDRFFLWLSFLEPHNPYQVPEPYFSTFPPDELPPVRAGPDALSEKGFDWEWTRHVCEERIRDTHPRADWDEQPPRMRANYFGMLRMIDDQVRRFIDLLEEEGRQEETLIVFLSDHGDFAGEYGLMRKGPGLPEALTRIPLQFSGPGIASHSGPHPAHVSIVDLLPTLCDLVGAPIPDGVQGRSLQPVLAEADHAGIEFDSVYAEHGIGGVPFTEDNDPTIENNHSEGYGHPYDELNSYSQSGRRCMVRSGDWKLVFDSEGEGRLYNVQSDPAELNDRYEDPECIDIRQQLLKETLRRRLETQDPLPCSPAFVTKSSQSDDRTRDGDP